MVIMVETHAAYPVDKAIMPDYPAIAVPNESRSWCKIFKPGVRCCVSNS